jgi:N-acetylglucosamine kinase-like BadF-type ATPase
MKPNRKSNTRTMDRPPDQHHPQMAMNQSPELDHEFQTGWLLGVDGGGTRTRAVLLTREGVVVGQGEAGPSNYHNVGIEMAGMNLRSATDQAFQSAGQPFQPVAHVFLGCAGVKAPVDGSRLESAAEAAGLVRGGGLTVANDLHNALAGGLNGRPGIALIAGTGTNCLGADAKGNIAFCGGWGWLLDDEGGGCGLALSALRLAVRAADGRGRRTQLTTAAVDFFGLTCPEEILARLYAQAWTPDELAAFAPVVVRLANEGDPTASHVLQEGSKALGALVAGVAHKLDFPDGPEVVILGGCARSGPPYQPLVEQAVLSACPAARIVEPEFSTTHGAALNALRATGVQPLPELIFQTSIQ